MPLSSLCLCHPRPSSPPLTATAIATVNNHHQFFRTVDDNNHQNPLNAISHQGWQLRLLSSAAVVDDCGSNGIFAAADNDKDRRRTVGSIPPPPPSMTTIVDKDQHCRRHYQPPLQLTMTAIAVVNDNDRSRRLHPKVASIDKDCHQRRLTCQRMLGLEPSTQGKATFKSIPKPPPLTTIVVDKGCQRRRQQQQ
jgi:hypothetical protein